MPRFDSRRLHPSHPNGGEGRISVTCFGWQATMKEQAMSVSVGRWETSRRCKAASVPLRLSQDR
jgi:hypothetical protein